MSMMADSQLAEVRSRFWEDWRKRFDAVVNGSPAGIGPEVEASEQDLLARASGVPLKLDLGLMTVADWSLLLLGPLLNEPGHRPIPETPMWLAAPAAVHLGMGHQFLVWLAEERNSKNSHVLKELEWMGSWLDRVARSGELGRYLAPHPSALIVAREDDSPSGVWRTDAARFGALRWPAHIPMLPGMIESLFRPGIEASDRSLEPVLFIEPVPEESKSQLRVEEFWNRQSWQVRVLVSESDTIHGSHSAVLAPQNLGDAITQARRAMGA